MNEETISKVALAVWNGRISPVFDVARRVRIITLRGRRPTERLEAGLPGMGPHQQAASLVGLGVQTLICGALSQPMAASLAAAGIQVLPFTAGEVDAVFKAWLDGNLPQPVWRMPGCGRGRRFGSRGGFGRGRGRGRNMMWDAY